MPRVSRFFTRRVVSLVALAVAAACPLWTARAQGPTAPAAAPPARAPMTAERLAALVAAADQQLPYVPGEVLIRFRDGVAADGQRRALTGVRSQPAVSALRWVGNIAVLHDASEPDPEVLAQQLRLQPEVAWAEPNYLRRLHRLQPNDPGFTAYQWNLRMLEMPRAWDVNPGGSADLIVAVVDSGLTTDDAVLPLRTFNGVGLQDIAVPVGTNPDISLSKFASPIDFVGAVPGPVVDFAGHGTHVAGTIGQDANDLAEVGVAFSVKLMPVKVCHHFWDVQFELALQGIATMPPPSIEGCMTDRIVAGIRHAADNGAKVINVSLGGPSPSEALRETLQYAVSKGAFVAISAGNDYEEGNPIFYPAAYGQELEGVMTVGAIGPNRARAPYSGTASGVEIAAPGGDSRQGGASAMIWQATIFELDSVPGVIRFPRFDRYYEKAIQGTSMAAPHVAGLAALIMSQGVSNPAAVEALIKATATDLGAPGRDDEYGFGLIQPRTALRGFGIFTE